MKTYTAVAPSWFSSGRDLLSGGKPIGRLLFKGWAGGGLISLLGQHYEIVKESLWGSALTVRLNQHVPCRVSFFGAFIRVANFVFEGVTYTLTWPAWGNSPRLEYGGNSTTRIASSGLTRRKLEANFDDEVPAVVCALVLWLIVRKQIDDAAATTA